jgi:enoyl-[acyl-carrier protein] reductase I
MGFLAGKKLLITGVLSNRSIAYGIAKACHAQGAELAFSYVGERFKDRITEFRRLRFELVFDCDVGDDEQIERLFPTCRPTGPPSTALCTASALPRAKPSPAIFWTASAASLPHRPRHQRLQLPGHGQGRPALPERQVGPADADLPGRRCAPSPTTTPWAWPRPAWKPRCATWPSLGKLGTAAACASTASAPARSRPWRPAASRTSASCWAWWPRRSPLRRNVTIEDVGNVAAFLLSDLASGVTSPKSPTWTAASARPPASAGARLSGPRVSCGSKASPVHLDLAAGCARCSCPRSDGHGPYSGNIGPQALPQSRTRPWMSVSKPGHSR